MRRKSARCKTFPDICLINRRLPSFVFLLDWRRLEMRPLTKCTPVEQTHVKPEMLTHAVVSGLKLSSNTNTVSVVAEFL